MRIGITTPDQIPEMLGFEKQNTPESTSIYISNNLYNKKNTTDDSLMGGDVDENKGTADI